MNIQDKIAQRKAQLTAAAEYSDKAIDQLAQIELGQDSINVLSELCSQMDKMVKKQNADAYNTNPKWEYGPVNSMIGKFISQWVYLPDILKDHMGLDIPATAFSAADVEAWGKLTRCNPLGEVLHSIPPDLESVAIQVELVKAYLKLPFTAEVMTQEQWENKERVAKVKSLTKSQEIDLALKESNYDDLHGIPTFQI